MHVLLGVLSLVLVAAVIGVLAKRQLVATRSPVPVLQTPVAGAAKATTGTVKEQSQRIQQQYRQAIEDALQQARPVPEDK